MMADKANDGGAAVAKYGTVAITPEGETPAIVKVDTTEITGRIVSLNPQKRRITFEDPQGKKRTLKLSQKIKIWISSNLARRSTWRSPTRRLSSS
jgi:hypothetical protein